MKEEMEGMDVWDSKEKLSGIRVQVEGGIKKLLSSLKQDYRKTYDPINREKRPRFWDKDDYSGVFLIGKSYSTWVWNNVKLPIRNLGLEFREKVTLKK